MTKIVSLISLAVVIVLAANQFDRKPQSPPKSSEIESMLLAESVNLPQSNEKTSHVQSNETAVVPNSHDKHAIRFPDGETVSIRLRQRPSKVIIPNASSLQLDLLEAHAILSAALADNTANAAFQMWELRQFCILILGDKASLDNALGSIYQQRGYAGPWGLTLRGEGSGQRIVEMADTAQRHFAQCRDIESLDGEMDIDWLARAAEMGDSEALKKLGATLGQTEAAVHTFEQAWQSGEIYANAWLSSLYANGFTNADGAVVRDATQAFAHQFLFASLLQAKYAEQGGAESLFAKRAWDRVADMETGLHAHELGEAYDMAKTLLHGACCLR